MKPLVAAFAFLTRLPVWRGPLRDVDLGRSVSFFPLVGLVLGFGLTGLRPPRWPDTWRPG